MIEPLSPTAIGRAVITLERAFASDPMFRWLFPDPGQRSQALRRLLRVPIRYGIRYGHVTASHDAKAVTIWLPPGQTMTAAGMIRCGMLTVPFHVGLRPFLNFGRANDIMGALHKKHVPEPHWYLLIVGVDPELQGQGIGAALVKEGLARADEAKHPCYLETSEERNLAFYQRHGFSVVGRAPLGKGGPPGWAMRRNPQSAD